MQQQVMQQQLVVNQLHQDNIQLLLVHLQLQTQLKRLRWVQLQKLQKMAPLLLVTTQLEQEKYL